MAVITTTSIKEVHKENRWAAEYFDPRYNFIERGDIPWTRIGRILINCQYGLSISMNEKGIGFPILRMNEIEDCFVNSPVKFADIKSGEFNQFKLKLNDVLFNRTNSYEFVGRTGIVKEEINSVFASYLVRINSDSSKILPEFLAMYLNTAFGIGQIKRRAMRSINQANVSASELKKIQIPLFDLKTQKRIAGLVNDSYALKNKSKNLYSQATQLLERELGLESITFTKDLSFRTGFLKINLSGRIDSQYFKPGFEQLIAHLGKNFKTLKLGNIVSKNRRGIQPVYVSNGKINVVNSQHITPVHLAYDNFETTSEKEFNLHPEAHIQYEDILVYTTGAYIGQSNPYLSTEPAFASNHVNLLRVKTEIDSVYVALVLNTLTGKLQTEQHSRGSAQAELYPHDIAKFIIPLLPETTMNEIGSLVRESLKALHSSKELLAQAKSEVETLIEQAAQTA